MTRDVGGIEPAGYLRLFVALPVPASSALAIHASLTTYRDAYPDARWLAPAQYHVTLRFLGSVDVALVPALRDAVERCADDSVPFPVTVGRGGCVRGRSGVVWLGLDAGREEVTETADRLDGLLPPVIRAGLRPTRPAPHLTIARRAPAGLAPAVREEAMVATWTAERMVLFRSHTGTAAGSRYEPITEARLAA